MADLDPISRKFILHWGEMGTRWGINRTVAQIHALLYLSPEPLHAECISDTLMVARSNVSNSLKELQGWGIVRVAHVLGDRRDHFESLKDPWEMFRIVLEERKKREIDPTLGVLEECIAQARQHPPKDPEILPRLEAMQSFFQTTTSWYEVVRKWPTEVLVRFMKMGDRVRRLISPGS